MKICSDITLLKLLKKLQAPNPALYHYF